MSFSATQSAGAAASATQNTAVGSGSGQNALASLTSNYQSFLKMLMTQLQNQDPTSPMDTGQFTTELVQFAGVEQQINTNSNLTQLIQATQGNTLIQSSQLVGKPVQVTSGELSLQKGSAGVTFSSPSAGTTAIGVFDSSGQQVYAATVTAAQGDNTWSWNGQRTSGSIAPDGAYTVAVSAIAPDGSTTPLAFSVDAVVTGVQQQDSAIQLQLGQLSVPMSAVKSVSN